MTRPLVGASTFCLLFQPWREAARAILDMGFKAIELFGEAPQGHFTQLNPGDRQALRKLSEQCELSLHAPGYELNVASANPCNRDEAVRQYREAVYLAAEIAATRLVLHEGHMSYWKLDRAEARRAAVDGLRAVADVARQVGVAIALENTNYGKFAMYESWQEWAALASELGDPRLGLVLDTGHACVAGWDISSVIRALAPRIVQFHIHDNRGASDDHLPPGEGVIDWDGIRTALLDAECGATLILESGPFQTPIELQTGKRWLDKWLR